MTDATPATRTGPSRRPVAVVPHTHWDREWYEPYQSFRLRLVDMLDRLLPLLEGDPAYARFLLDGQMAVVDDYLEVRPEAEGRIRALAASGRLTMGPWYILMDEFLVSGETIVRDLQLGIERGAAFGGVMPVGYLPDMFGHVAQMPQILRQAGFEHAVVWRGVPSTVHRSAFWWEAPDGSTVRCEYLPVGYSNGSSLPDDAKELVRRTADHVEEIGEFIGDGPLLLMNGTDHQEPQPWLGRVVAEANDLAEDLAFTVTSLPEYLAGAGTDGLPRWRGELRSGWRANVLMGVASNRVDVKQAAARAERELERRAEPYAALFGGRDGYPHRLLDLAWRHVVRNAAHDSVCACSVDEVVDAVVHRYAEAATIGRGLAERALGSLARSLAEPGATVVNPSPRRRGGVVELVLPGASAPADTQPLPEPPGAFGIPRGLGALTLDAGTVRTILGMLPNGAQIDTHTWIQGVSVSEDDTGIDVTIEFGPEERFDVPIASIKQDLYTRLGARPDTVVRIRIDQPPSQPVLARVAAVAGFGWQRAEPAALAHPVAVEDGGDGPVLANGLVTVAVDAATGTYAVDGLAGFGRLVDGGDHGDSYNYSPPAQDRLVDTPEAVRVEVTERGPVRATVVVSSDYRWPSHVDGASRSRVGEVPVTVTTTVSLHADERVLRVTTAFTNPARDHRLRVHFPLPEPADHSEAECAFTVVRRGLVAEGRPDEFGLPTFPSRRFVRAGGLTVVHEGLLEYELVDVEGEGEAARARGLALTVLRATGMLSRLGMAYRPLPAGPLTPVAGLQLLGRPVEARYAVAVGDPDPYALADDVLLPLEVVHAFGGGSRPASGSALSVEGAEVSAVRRRAGGLELRVFNPTDTPARVRLGDRSGWLVDLRGRPVAPVDGGFDLAAQAIATVQLAEPSPPGQSTG